MDSLAPGKVPTAVALSQNNEFAFVTVWDTQAFKGQVAVIAIQGYLPLSGLRFKGYDLPGLYTSNPNTHCGYGVDNCGVPGTGGYYYGLPNGLQFSAMKVIGYVDLPGMAAPTSISAVTDSTKIISGRRGRLHWNPRLGCERDAWRNITDDMHASATAGYVLVASRAENKVAVIDIEPLIQYYRKM